MENTLEELAAAYRKASDKYANAQAHCVRVQEELTRCEDASVNAYKIAHEAKACLIAFVEHHKE